MHHAAVNAELARLRHAESLESVHPRDLDVPGPEVRTNPTFLDALSSLATKLLPELHAPVHRSPRAAGSA
jgi:hypothetical protein